MPVEVPSPMNRNYGLYPKKICHNNVSLNSTGLNLQCDLVPVYSKVHFIVPIRSDSKVSIFRIAPLMMIDLSHVIQSGFRMYS